MSEVQQQYEQLTAGAGYVDLSGRTQIELTGADRAALLHNLCTNDVLRLQTGQGCEAFLTSVRGKTLAHLFVFCGSESLLIDAVAGQAEAIVPHLDKYIITEDVQVCDRSDTQGELAVAGARAADALAKLVECEIPAERFAHRECTIDGNPVHLRRVDLTGPDSFLLATPADRMIGLTKALREAGVAECLGPAFNTARIEFGTPLFGQDIQPDNLPQELNRDQAAISFTKGCYLGQETVARIDALGHVNKALCGVRFAGEQAPRPGTILKRDGTSVGRVTSCCLSPKLGCPLALAFLRRGSNAPGQQLDSEFGQAEVVALPV